MKREFAGEFVDPGISLVRARKGNLLNWEIGNVERSSDHTEGRILFKQKKNVNGICGNLEFRTPVTGDGFYRERWAIRKRDDISGSRLSFLSQNFYPIIIQNRAETEYSSKKTNLSENEVVSLEKMFQIKVVDQSRSSLSRKSPPFCKAVYFRLRRKSSNSVNSASPVVDEDW